MTGNLIDVLQFFDNDENLMAYQSDKLVPEAVGLIPNIPIPILMIPPEHREQIRPLLESLKEVLKWCNWKDTL